MCLFHPLSVDEVPYIQIIRWKIYRVTSKLWPEQTYHLCGYNLTEHSGRVSSAIIKVGIRDDKLVAETESGRLYELVQEHGFDPDGAYVFGVWCKRNQVKEFFDVSEEFLQ